MSDKYRTWKEKAEKHDRLHDPTVPRIHWKEDLSCKECYPLLVINRKFVRFWKWYRRTIPEVANMGYTSKTEETFTEMLVLIKEEQSKDRDYKIRGKIRKLLGCIRYDESPKLKEKEIRNKLLDRIVISDGFKKSSKEIGSTVDEIIIESCSEAESEVSMESGEEFDVEDDWYEVMMARVMEHEEYHTKGRIESKEDLSCRRCFPVRKGIEEDEEFIEFWRWYRKLTKAESFSGLTEKLFDEIQQVNFSEVFNRTEENAQKIWTLMCTMRYQGKPKLTRYRLTLKMMEILAASKGFKISLREAAEKLKRARTRKGVVSGEMTRESSPGRKDSPKRGTFMEELNTELEELARTWKLEEAKDEEIEIYETEITRIYCGKLGPYKVTGNGSRYEIIFEEIEEEYIDLEEFRGLCQERGLDDEEIIGQIRSRLRGEDIIGEGKDPEIEEEIQIEKDIKRDPKIPSSPEVEKENSEKGNTTSKESSDTEEEEITMAQPWNSRPIKHFNGREDEDIEQWISAVDRIGGALGIEDPDNDDCPRLNYALAHLNGPAADWYDTNKTPMNITRWGSGNNDRQLKERLRTAFSTPERQQRWQQKMYETEQRPGENVESYAQRFREIARRIGNNVTERGKAMTFTQSCYQC